MDIKFQKQQIRQEMKELRKGMDIFTIKDLSEKVIANLYSLDLYQADKFFIYNSFGGEVETHKLISNLINLGKKVYLPKIVGKQMQSVRVDETTSFEMNLFGILEPIGDGEVIDNFIAIMPCLAVDLHGNRIGYGGGYYDKFLKNKYASRIALCYDFQILDNIKVADYDVPLDVIVSDKRVIEIQKQNPKTK